MTSDRVNLGGEHEGHVLKGSESLKDAREQVSRVDFTFPISCPKCGERFAPKLRPEGRLREALTNYLLHRANFGLAHEGEPIPSGDERQGSLGSEPMGEPGRGFGATYGETRRGRGLIGED